MHTSLKTSFGRTLAAPLAASGAPRLVQRLRHRTALSILVYHGVTDKSLPFPHWGFISAAAFRRHLDYLRRHFDLLPLAEGAGAALSGSLRRPAACITFDDGYWNNYRVAFPILREAGIPGTIFLTTGLVGSDATVWDAEVYRALGRTKERAFVWNGRRFVLANPMAKRATWIELKRLLKVLELPGRQEAIASICRTLGVPAGDPIPEDSPFRMLHGEAIRAMQESGLITFGAHTVHHVIVGGLPAADKRREILTSIGDVSELTGTPCRMFAYPNGRREDYDEECLAVLREGGVDLSATTRESPCAPGCPPLELPRYSIGARHTVAMLALKAHHCARRAAGYSPASAE
jgi:peptidoglycan/xylan/chitin deacetylase (PgdA/CDA1 family)